MKPSIVTQEQKFIFQEEFEARQQSLTLRASLVPIYDEQKRIKEQVDNLLARSHVLEEQATVIKDKLRVLQTLL